jgi:hypothetical protein
MTLAISTITNSIAALVVTGLTIKNMDEIPTTLTGRDCPVLIPDMNNFISGFEVNPDSFGSASVRKWTTKYTLNYLLIYAQAGIGRVTVVENYAGMVQMAYAFFDTILSTDTISGSVDHLVGSIKSFQVIDWGGVSFHTCNVSLDIMEFVN